MHSFQDVTLQGQMRHLTDGLPSKSAKIRTLGQAGYSRQQIADFLGIRYQFVRNVLVDAKRVADGKKEASEKQVKAGVREASHFAFRVEVGPNGEVRIPSHILAAAGSAVGKHLLVRFDDDEIKLVTPEATARKVQAAVRKFVPEGVSLVDELLKERRREATHEQDNA